MFAGNHTLKLLTNFVLATLFSAPLAYVLVRDPIDINAVDTSHQWQMALLMFTVVVALIIMMATKNDEPGDSSSGRKLAMGGIQLTVICHLICVGMLLTVTAYRNFFLQHTLSTVILVVASLTSIIRSFWRLRSASESSIATSVYITVGAPFVITLLAYSASPVMLNFIALFFIGKAYAQAVADTYVTPSADPATHSY